MTDSHPTERLSTLAALACVVSVMLLLFTLAIFSWPAADDFCNRVLVDTRGFGGALHWLFFEWSGRLITGIPLYATFSWVDIPALRWVSVMLAAGLLWVTWQMCSLALPWRVGVPLPLFAFVLVCIVLGLYPLLGQTVFWATGGIVYLLPLIVLLIWLSGVRRSVVHGRVDPRGPWFPFLLSIAVGNAIELVVPIAVCYLAVTAVRRWPALSSPLKREVWWRVAGLALGAAVLIAAPGNYLRAQATPASFRLDPTFLAQHYGQMLRTTASAGATLIAFLMALLVVTALVARGRWTNAGRVRGMAMLMRRDRAHQAFDETHTSEVREALSVTGSFGPALVATGEVRNDEVMALAISALMSLLPVLAAPAQYAPRNGLYMLVGLLLAALIPATRVLLTPSIARVALVACTSLAVAGTLTVGSWLLRDIQSAQTRRGEQVARDRFIRNAAVDGHTDLRVPPIATPAPSTLHALDMTSDPKAIVNWCVATYYHIGSIVIEPIRP